MEATAFDFRWKPTADNGSPIKYVQSVSDKPKILIVDDEPFNIEILQTIIEKLLKISVKDACEIARNGSEAIQKVKDDVASNGGKKSSFNLILMDCLMPEVDGYQATIGIRDFLYTSGIDQPIIIAVTGHSGEDSKQKALNTGMNMMIVKPCSPD